MELIPLVKFALFELSDETPNLVLALHIYFNVFKYVFVLYRKNIFPIYNLENSYKHLENVTFFHLLLVYVLTEKTCLIVSH